MGSSSSNILVTLQNLFPKIAKNVAQAMATLNSTDMSETHWHLLLNLAIHIDAFSLAYTCASSTEHAATSIERDSHADCKGNSQIPIFQHSDSATHVTLCDSCDSV